MCINRYCPFLPKLADKLLNFKTIIYCAQAYTLKLTLSLYILLYVSFNLI